MASRAQPSPPTLETLPTEIKIMILKSFPTVQALNSLLDASYKYHQVYDNENIRYLIWKTVLGNEFNH